MARPIKKGLDYFPMDCDFDDKIYQLEAQLGGEGCWRLIKIWKEIYKWEGYYIGWSERRIRIFAGKNNYEIEDIKSLVGACLDIGLFDKEKFEEYCILTSNGIQKRYINAKKIYESLTVIEEYLTEDTFNFIEGKSIKLNLTHIKNNLTKVKNNLTKVKSNLTTQSKVKESKGKKSKEKGINSSLHTSKEDKTKPVKKDYSSGEYNPIWLTEKEYQKLVDRFGKEETDDKIYEFSTYSKYDRYTNHYSTLLNWLKRDRQQRQVKEQQIEEEEFEPDSYVNFRKELKKK